MNLIKFLYDVLVWICSHYSVLPVSFKEKFPEEVCVNARLYLSDLVQSDSVFNEIFSDYE